MEEAATKRYAVVTGANKGIGLGVCKQLVSHGIIVVLTARDVRRGLEAVEKLRESGLSDHLLFRQHDVQDPTSIVALANIIRNQFGKLDILVNNAGVSGDALRASGFYMPDGWGKGVLNDAENLTEERLDEFLTEFLKDFKECSLASKGWPPHISAYIVSKVTLNAYTRILAKRYQTFHINCVCPGFVESDINQNTGTSTIEEGAESLVRLALLPKDGPSGLYFDRKEESPF